MIKYNIIMGLTLLTVEYLIAGDVCMEPESC